MLRIQQLNRLPTISLLRNYSSSKKDAEKVIPKNLLEGKFQAIERQPNGPIVDNKPFKIALKAGKKYSWCLCGQSKSQPLCDGTHKYVHYKIKEKPIQFEVEKDGDYWICMCRQTKHRPFCDGTHKEPQIQEKNVRFF
ncbi:CDGSH iron-sulfur domain-containing protein 3, mitochondrial [Sitodiplosis mosellana]|uniref:CDGSH iron-sulfur domain-containing protein 3, mitochondrial n=1 Tax=Sitodiplosis mosellana TaxID=263140 RepID=UPI0024442CEC|nr:CDGSH iron-sulfur domain-containing protein 3, mitochondrial [Sitodiplosis mosellana]